MELRNSKERALGFGDAFFRAKTPAAFRGSVDRIVSRLGEVYGIPEEHRHLSVVSRAVAGNVAQAIDDFKGSEVSALKKAVVGAINNGLKVKGLSLCNGRVFNQWDLGSFCHLRKNEAKLAHFVAGLIREAAIESSGLPVEEYLSALMLNGDERIKGHLGYANVAALFFRGSMQKAFLQMSALCKALGLPFERLEWGNQFNGDAKEFREKITRQ